MVDYGVQILDPVFLLGVDVCDVLYLNENCARTELTAECRVRYGGNCM